MTLIHQFLAMMACERRATRATLSAYETDLWNFFEFLKDQKAEEVTPTNIQAYLATQSHLSGKTVARRMSSLRQFYGYLVNRGVRKENPFSLVKVVPLKTKSFPSLSPTHVERLWEGAKAWTSPEGKRLSLLFQILQERDQPVKEIVSLPLIPFLQEPESHSPTPPCHSRESGNPKGFVLSRSIVMDPRLRGDDSREQENPHISKLSHCRIEKVKDLPLIANNILQDYLKVRSYFLTHGQDSPWLFPSSSQKGHLTPQRFGQLLKELGLKHGIDPGLISLSTFRYGLHHFKKLSTATGFF